MKLKRILIATLLAVTLATPAVAASNWVEDFLRRYDPRQSDSTTNIGQFIQTGIVPVTLNDVVNMMIDRNLDIRTNRMSPRSSYFQSLVFYRALQPSIRFSGTITRDSSASNTQLNGATVLSQLRGFYSVNFSQLLPTGTSLAVDVTMNRSSSNSAFSRCSGPMRWWNSRMAMVEAACRNPRARSVSFSISMVWSLSRRQPARRTPHQADGRGPSICHMVCPTGRVQEGEASCASNIFTATRSRA